VPSVQCSCDVDFFLSLLLCQPLDFTLKPLSEAFHQGGPTSKNYVAVEVDAQILITKLYRLSCNSCDTTFTVLKKRVIPACKLGIKQYFRCRYSLLKANLDDLTTWQLITSLFLVQRIVSTTAHHFFLVVFSNMAHLFFDFLDDFHVLIWLQLNFFRDNFIEQSLCDVLT